MVNDAHDLAKGMAAAVVVFKPDEDLLKVLLSVLDASMYRLLVFLNGPVSDRVEADLRQLSDARIVASTTNLGLGAALNALLDVAREEGFSKILLFDQDSTPDYEIGNGLLTRFDELTKSGCRIAVLGPRLTPPQGSSYLPLVYSWRRPRPGDPLGVVDFVPTSGSLLSVAAWLDVGPFRTDYFIGGIDVEWGFRAWDRGWVCAVTNDIQMVHRWGDEAGTDRRQQRQRQILRHSPLRLYYYVRNMVAALRLHHIPLRWKCRQGLRLIGQVGLVLWRRPRSEVSLQLVWLAMRDGWTGRLGPVSLEVARHIENPRSGPSSVFGQEK